LSRRQPLDKVATAWLDLAASGDLWTNGAGERQLLREIILPAALPQIMTGLQVALPISIIVTIVTEMLMAGQGLGGAMIAASRFAGLPRRLCRHCRDRRRRVVPRQRHDRAAPAPPDLASGSTGADDGVSRQRRA
jgi:hypothetical protein